MSRPVKDDQQLRRLWREGRPLAEIAKRLGYAQVCSVSLAAKRLGLPSRLGPRRASAHS
jgi:hypothetical protein